LRIASPIEPRERLRIIVDQLAGIGGGRSLGFGINRVRSLPDGISKALDEYLYKDTEDDPETLSRPVMSTPLPMAPQQTAFHPVGELCPECGEATMINEEGCRKCYTCGHSEC
jgi:ribonucleoside-diphosphate reductase alpha chain